MATSWTEIPGPGRVYLRVRRANGAIRFLAFVRGRRGVEVWETADEERVAPARTRTLRAAGDPGALRIACWLASGEVVEPISARDAATAYVWGLDGDWDWVVLNAWTRGLRRMEPALDAVLSLDAPTLEAVARRSGGLDVDPDALRELGEAILAGNRDWLGKWEDEIAAEVDRRVTALGARGDALENAVMRDFVEECLLKLGRLPLPGETEASWAGRDLRVGALGRAARIRLGLESSRRVRRYRIRCSYRSAADTYATDVEPGPGWYFHVLNPNPDWILCDAPGPYRTPAEAWEDAAFTGVDE